MFLHRPDGNPEPRTRLWLAWPLAMALAWLAVGASGQQRAADIRKLAPSELASPERFRCVGKNRFSGAASIPIERNGVTTDRAYSMFFIDPVQGHATIIYGERYHQLAPLMQAFVRRHECQHANGELDEIMANCGALRQMRAQGLSAEQEAQIARWHAAEGAIDARYGGSGAAFWQRTLACAGSR